MSQTHNLFTIALSLKCLDRCIEINCFKESIGSTTAIELAKDVYSKLQSEEIQRLAKLSLTNEDIKSWLHIDLISPSGKEYDSEGLAWEIANKLLLKF